ncbi:DUF4331 family protein [Plantactinospora sp. CA-294935]|uniref:DUF4331 family protein n=1 Tax=Plantactinospora sp. CA-294935 TaxID=3240012 RepID=UPI003D8D4DFF
MSHHLDSPLALQDTRLDLTDQYVFPGESGTVLVMNLNSSTAGKDAKPGFHPEARYEFKVHLDGATVENLSYRITFDEPRLCTQVYSVPDGHPGRPPRQQPAAGAEPSGVSRPRPSTGAASGGADGQSRNIPASTSAVRAGLVATK